MGKGLRFFDSEVRISAPLFQKAPAVSNDVKEELWRHTTFRNENGNHL